MTLGWKWIVDWLNPYIASIIRADKTIYSAKTKYQYMDIIETKILGKMLILDGKVQSSEFDEYIYHESLVHPVMITHPNPEKVLVLGGGEGATTREVLRYRSVKKVVWVDLDREVVEACRKYLPEWNEGVFDDPRVELIIGDGRKFLKETKEKFDVIIIDLVDPFEGGPALLLYTKEFYEYTFKALTDEGLFVTQATSTSYTPNIFASIYATIKSVFPIVSGYHAFIPAFQSMWGFIIGSKVYDPSKLSEEDIDSLLRKRINSELRFYEGSIHRWLFILPKELRKAIETGVVATDKNPDSLKMI